MALTFLSYSVSDKMMMWLLLNSVFVGAYLFTTQKDTLFAHAGNVWKMVQEMTAGLVEKIPKHKVE